MREQWSFTVEYDVRVVFAFLPNNRAVFEDIAATTKFISSVAKRRGGRAPEFFLVSGAVGEGESRHGGTADFVHESQLAALPVVASRAMRLGSTVATVGFPNVGLQGFAQAFLNS